MEWNRPGLELWPHLRQPPATRARTPNRPGRFLKAKTPLDIPRLKDIYENKWILSLRIHFNGPKCFDLYRQTERRLREREPHLGDSASELLLLLSALGSRATVLVIFIFTTCY